VTGCQVRATVAESGEDQARTFAISPTDNVVFPVIVGYPKGDRSLFASIRMLKKPPAPQTMARELRGPAGLSCLFGLFGLVG